MRAGRFARGARTVLGNEGAEVVPSPRSLRFRFSTWTELSPLSPALPGALPRLAKQRAKEATERHEETLGPLWQGEPLAEHSSENTGSFPFPP